MRTMSYCGKTNFSLSLSLSLSENKLILYQFLGECVLISFERIWKFKFSWFYNGSRFQINKKKKKMTLLLEWLMFNSVCQQLLGANLISLCRRCLPNVKILRVVFISRIWHCFCPVLVCLTSFVFGVINYYFIKKNCNCFFFVFYTLVKLLMC